MLKINEWQNEKKKKKCKEWEKENERVQKTENRRWMIDRMPTMKERECRERKQKRTE